MMSRRTFYLCVRLLQTILHTPVSESMTIYDVIRALGGLVGHLGKLSDGEPGWITVWRGFGELTLLERDADLQRGRGRIRQGCQSCQKSSIGRALVAFRVSGRFVPHLWQLR